MLNWLFVQLGAEQKELPETPLLAPLRGDLFQRVPPEGKSGYLLTGRVQLHHRPGQHQWHHGPLTAAELGR